MTYYYLAADSSTGGPETLEVLTGMVAGGTVSLATLVVPAGGEDWTPLARVLRYFYSDAAGGTAGPVAFSELQRLNQTGVLDGGSWVLEEGAAQWKTLESVITAGGAEVFVPSPAEVPVAAAATHMPRTATGAYRPPGGRTQAVAHDPYAAPRSGTHRVVVRHRRTGGMNRLQYFLYAVVLETVLLVMLVLLVGAMLDLGFQSLTRQTTFEEFAAIFERSRMTFLIGGLVLMVMSIAFAIQRLKNIGWPWYFIFVSLVPLANLWIGLALVAWPPGYAHHKRFDTPAKVISGVYGLFIVALIVTGIMAPKKPKPKPEGGVSGAGLSLNITRITT